MNSFRENRWLRNFLLVSGAALLISLWFLFHAKGFFAIALTEFNAAANKRSRLEHLNPFPNEENFLKTQTELHDYHVALGKAKEELRTQMPPLEHLAPSEFQTRLQQTILSTTEKARANRVKLPENFHLGFDEFTTALPNSAASAAILAQELGQIELLLSILIDGRVDAINTLARGVALPGTPVLTTLPPKGGAIAKRQLVERAVVNLSFIASRPALRKVLNQIASSGRQFFIVRTLYVCNEQLKGPSREQTATTKTTEAATGTAPAGVKFIVGNEHLQATVRIEMLRFFE
jgi:hypothetical protein